MGLRRKSEKKHWEGVTRLDHLGYVLDTWKMVFGIVLHGLDKFKGIAAWLLSQALRSRCLVYQCLLRHFSGIAISSSLSMPPARVCTRSLYDLMKIACSRNTKRKNPDTCGYPQLGNVEISSRSSAKTHDQRS